MADSRLVSSSLLLHFWFIAASSLWSFSLMILSKNFLALAFRFFRIELLLFLSSSFYTNFISFFIKKNIPNLSNFGQMQRYKIGIKLSQIIASFIYLLKVNTYKIICLPCFLPRTDYIVGNFSFRLDNLRKWMGKELVLIFIRKLRCNMDILSFKTDGCLRKINKNINTLSFVLGIIYRMI